MANPYGYTPEEMRSTGTTLRTAQEQFGAQVTAAMSAVTALIGSGFTTAAASGAYTEQFNALADGLNKVNANLLPLGDFLIQYADSVVEMDNQMGAALRG